MRVFHDDVIIVPLFQVCAQDRNLCFVLYCSNLSLPIHTSLTMSFSIVWVMGKCLTKFHNLRVPHKWHVLYFEWSKNRTKNREHVFTERERLVRSTDDELTLQRKSQAIMTFKKCGTLKTDSIEKKSESISIRISAAENKSSKTWIQVWSFFSVERFYINH